jgi:two-component system nitrogen regulation sensor histidine kinase NtrY
MMALGAGLPGILVSLVLLWSGDFSSRLRWTLTLLVLALWWGWRSPCAIA